MRIRDTLKLALSVGASMGALAVATTVAAADSGAPTAPSTVEEVVVTGFRSSLAKAILEKRQQTSEVDAILAEDIGKFPDLNLAESLQRIPGVAITREGGEGRQITVRGLGPQYTRTRINGMEASASIGSPDNDGGVNRSRSFDFTVFASDLFSKLEVHKTSEGDIDEGSLGATVDLHSAQPFDYKPKTLILSAKADYNDQSGSTGPRLSAIVADTSDDGKFGVLASLSYSHRKFSDNGFSTVRWDEAKVLSTGGTTAAPLVGFGSVMGTNCQVYPLPAACVAADSALHPRFPRYDLYQDDQGRLGASLSLQWRPTDQHQISFDLLHSRWDATRQEDYIEAPGFSGTGKCSSAATCTSVANIAVLADTINSLGVMTAGTFNGVDVRTEERFDKMHTEFDQATLSSVDHWTPKLWTETLVGVNASNFANPVQTTLGWDNYNVQGFSYAFNGLGGTPTLNFGSANLSATGPWVLTEVRSRPQTADNDFATVAETAHYDWSANLKFSGGASFKEYEFKTTSLRLVNGESVTATNAYASLRSLALSSYGASHTANGVTWFAPSVGSAGDPLSLESSSLFALNTLGDLGNNFSIKEKDTGAFVQGDFVYPILGRDLRGNLGMRGVETEQNSNGFEYVGGVLSPVVANRSYAEGLPSANFAWDATDKSVLRLSAARVMTRPDLTSLVGSTSVTVSGTSYSVKTGNPLLKPFLANSYDMAYEFYPMRGAILSVAVFRKDIISLVTTNTLNIPFSGNPFGVPDSAAASACGSTPGCSAAATWAFSVPTNTHGGHVIGMEVNYQQPFTFLPGFLRHTGLLANFTAVNSRVNYPNGSGGYVTGQLLGLSRGAANATLYYEDDKWSIRVSEAYRSKYLSKVPGQEVGTNADGFGGTNNVDASIQYTLTSHLKFTLEGVNLTNQAEQEFDDTSRMLPYYVHKTGREFLAGARYQF